MAWVKCEGIKRREKLTDMGAPDEIVRSQTDVLAIAREMRLGPPDLFDEVYIYDNMVQSWLIEISDRDADVRPPTRSQMRAILKTRHSKRSGDGEAFPWSMWFPDTN